MVQKGRTRQDGRAAKIKANLEIADRIRFLRTQLLRIERQEDFANRVGVTRGAVGNWELGKGIRRASLARIAEEFQISLSWLALGVGAPRIGPSLEVRAAKELPPEEVEAFLADAESLLRSRIERWTARARNSNGTDDRN